MWLTDYWYYLKIHFAQIISICFTDKSRGGYCLGLVTYATSSQVCTFESWSRNRAQSIPFALGVAIAISRRPQMHTNIWEIVVYIVLDIHVMNMRPFRGERNSKLKLINFHRFWIQIHFAFDMNLQCSNGIIDVAFVNLWILAFSADTL